MNILLALFLIFMVCLLMRRNTSDASNKTVGDEMHDALLDDYANKKQRGHVEPVEGTTCQFKWVDPKE